MSNWVWKNENIRNKFEWNLEHWIFVMQGCSPNLCIKIFCFSEYKCNIKTGENGIWTLMMNCIWRKIYKNLWKWIQNIWSQLHILKGVQFNCSTRSLYFFICPGSFMFVCLNNSDRDLIILKTCHLQLHDQFLGSGFSKDKFKSAIWNLCQAWYNSGSPAFMIFLFKKDILKYWSIIYDVKT